MIFYFCMVYDIFSVCMNFFSMVMMYGVYDFFSDVMVYVYDFFSVSDDVWCIEFFSV